MSEPGGAAALSSILMPTYPEPPVTFERGAGSWLYDSGGRAYLDFLSGIAVTSLGHSHPRVAAAVAEQARTLEHVSNLFGNTVGPEVASRLDRLVGGGTLTGRVFFTNSGAEANECAIKLARRWAGHGRYQVVSAYGSFHGRTLATLHATGQPEKHEPFQPLPEGFVHVPWDDLDALEVAAAREPVAAVLLEPIQGEGGVRPLSKGFLAEVRRLCDERGVLMIVDEIQTGLARTGRWFAFEADEIVPDVVTVAKALGNGMPIGACWARAEIAGAFLPGDHGSTFGGQPLAASAARATLEVMEEVDAPSLARARGADLAEGLASLPGISAVRGAGLLLGAVADRGAADVVSRALDEGLVVNAVSRDTIRLAPSLLVTEDEVAEALARLGRALAAGGRSAR